MGFRSVISLISSAALVVAGLPAQAVPGFSTQSTPITCDVDISGTDNAAETLAIQRHLGYATCDVVRLAAGSVSLTSTLTISRPVTLKSADSFFFSRLSGENLSDPSADHMISISGTGSGTVVLEELYIDDAGDSAVITDGNLRVNRVTFRSNSTSNTGAAIRSSGDDLTLDNSTFSQNVAAGDGGAIYHSGTGGIVMLGTNNFSGNESTSGSGGSVYSAADVSYEDIVAGDGSAGLDGGLISARSVSGLSIAAMGPRNGLLVAITFSAGRDGGVIHTRDAGYANQLGAVSSSNVTALQDGGFAYVAGLLNQSGGMTVASADAVRDGGVLYVGGNATLDELYVSQAQAGGHGGGVYVAGAGKNLSITGFLSANQLSSGGNGGVIAVNDGSVTLASSSGATIDDVVAGGSGGAIYAKGDITTEGVYVTRGGAGYQNTSAAFGGCFASATGNVLLKQDALFSSCIVYGTSATSISNGGAISAGGTVTAQGTLEIFDSIARNGGAISAGGLITLATADVRRNGASTNGGAIYTSGGLTVTNSLVANDNNANANGGGIYLVSGALTLGRADFSGNSALTGSGGAIYTQDTVNISGPASFVQNDAVTSGGAIAAQSGSGHTISVREGVFGGNSAASGGAISVTGGASVVVYRSIFESNQATGVSGKGGAIYGSNRVITSNSQFLGNDSAAEGGAISSPWGVTSVFSTFRQNTAAQGRSVHTAVLTSMASIYSDGSGAGGVVTTTTASDFGGNLFSSDPGSRFAAGDKNLSEEEIGLTEFLVSDFVRTFNYYPLVPTSLAREALSRTELDAFMNAQTEAVARALLQNLHSGVQSDVDLIGTVRSGNSFDAGAVEFVIPGAFIIHGAVVLSSGTQIELLLNPFPAAPVSDPDAFEIKVDGVTLEATLRDLTSMSRTLFIDLAKPVPAGAAVTLSYNTNTIVMAGQTDLGLRSYTDNPVMNNSTYTPSGPGYFGPILYVPADLGDLPVGEVVRLEGENLLLITEINLGGEDAKVKVISNTELEITIPEVEPGDYQLEVVSNVGVLTIQQQLSVVGGVSMQGLQIIIKRISETQAKIWAKNAVGVGKIQFKVGGREIAWIRAADETDPKLRKVNNLYYLVRTVNLKDGKNALEVYLDGERLRRVAYGR